MNSLVEGDGQYLPMANGLRIMALDLLEDADLKYALPGNPTLGEVFREAGDIERSYIDSFKHFKQDFTYRHADKEVETSIAKLKAWYAQLDAEFDTVLKGLSEADIANQTVDRGGDFKPSLHDQVMVYTDAVFIIAGKVSIYLHALGKANEQWKAWIG